MRDQMKRPELLIPASSLEVLKTAVFFGADAVYIGGEGFWLWVQVQNLFAQGMKEGIAFSGSRGLKVELRENIPVA